MSDIGVPSDRATTWRLRWREAQAERQRNSSAWKIVRHLLASPTPQAGMQARRQRRWRWLGFAAVLLFGVASLATAWWTGGAGWPWFWGSSVFAALGALGLLQPERPGQLSYQMEAVDTLREGILVGDETRAPLAKTQPLPPTTAQPQTEASLERLTPPSQTILDVSLIFLGAVLTFTNLTSPIENWQTLAVYMVLIFVGVVGLKRWWLAAHPSAVIADERGLSWRRGLRRHRLPWHEVRALCYLELPGEVDARSRLAPPQSIFWAVGARKMVAWSVHEESGYPPEDGSEDGSEDELLEEMDDPDWQLCDLVAARTGLPLRDLTEPVMRLATRWEQLDSRDALDPPQPVPIEAVPHADTARRGHPLRWLALVPVVAVIAAGLTVQFGQQRAYATQLATARAQAPLFLDSLAQSDGQWPESPLNDDTYLYRDGTYQLAYTYHSEGRCCGVYAWAPPTFGDAVVQVTTRLFSDSKYDEAGLVLRAEDASHTMLVFTVTPGGEWLVRRMRAAWDESGATDNDELARHDDAFIVQGAIHQGSGATNRLAVLMRGDSFAFFINDQLVGTYHDAGLTRGHVGVYMDGGFATYAAFSDFAVYPAPPPLPYLPV